VPLPLPAADGGSHCSFGCGGCAAVIKKESAYILP
jgi:hypothetical protein